MVVNGSSVTTISSSPFRFPFPLARDKQHIHSGCMHTLSPQDDTVHACTCIQLLYNDHVPLCCADTCTVTYWVHVYVYMYVYHTLPDALSNLLYALNCRMGVLHSGMQPGSVTLTVSESCSHQELCWTCRLR